jgi:hypothetical protein
MNTSQKLFTNQKFRKLNKKINKLLQCYSSSSDEELETASTTKKKFKS